MPVVPAQAGAQRMVHELPGDWMPACAGMTWKKLAADA